MRVGGYPKLNRPSWNSGRTRFENKDHARSERNRLRRELRARLPVDIADRIRTLIRNSLRRAGYRKDTKSAILLGCSAAEFKSHLECQFIDGMDWSNYGHKPGQWSIDHIIPLYTFDLSDPAQQQEAFHFTNCRPLWAVENMARKRPGVSACATMGFAQ